MRDALAHLVRYYVVDCEDKPVARSPYYRQEMADRTLRWHNGPQSDHVIGVPQRRPYRLILLIPTEAPHA